jgi:nitroreductase
MPDSSQESKLTVYEAMRTLRAVRRLRPDPVPGPVLRRVLDAACQAPTGGNRQPFRIVVVEDRARMAALGRLYSAAWYAYAESYRALTRDAPAAAQREGEKMLAAGNHLADHFAATPVLLVFCFDPRQMAITDARLPRVSVVGGASIYPAVQNALLACRAEGLGCVLTTLLCGVEDEVRRLLEIPEPWGTAAAIPIGWPLGRGHGPITRRPPEALAYADVWKRAWRADGSEPT